jgi:AcrR family transcriptional regulator
MTVSDPSQSASADQDSQRRKVLEAAFSAFNYAGYHAVSTDEIAKGLHISKKTLYKLFRSKEEILDAAIAQQFLVVEERLNQVLAGNPLPKPSVWFLAEEYVALHSLLSPQLTAEIKADVPYVHERINRFHKEHFHKTFLKLLKTWRDAGLVEYPSPTKALVAAFFRALDGQEDTASETLKFICGALVKGMAVKEKEKKK